MAKLEIPIHVYMDDLEEIINELKHLQTYKLFEEDDMVLIDCDEAIKIFTNHLRTEIRDTQTIKPAQQWIPCSERLPDDGQRVLMQLDIGTICVFDYYANGSTTHLVAWMPLPEPYKGEEHE